MIIVLNDGQIMMLIFYKNICETMHLTSVLNNLMPKLSLLKFSSVLLYTVPNYSVEYCGNIKTYAYTLITCR